MKIFIDFDDVLFNTKKFRNDMIRIFLKHGVSKKDFYGTYKDFPERRKKGIIVYDPEKHFKKVRNKLGKETEKLRSDFWKLVENSKKYVFRDVSRFLKNFKKRDLYIISFGNGDFQRKKILNSGICVNFKEVFIVSLSKGKIIRNIIKKEKIAEKEKIYFLDDRVEFIKEVKKYAPYAVAIFVKRKEGRYKDERNGYCDYEANDLREALKIINLPSLKNI